MNELINVLSQDGNLVVSSREVAINFEKEHNDTKKRIRELGKIWEKHPTTILSKKSTKTL